MSSAVEQGLPAKGAIHQGEDSYGQQQAEGKVSLVSQEGAQLKQREVDERIELSDADVVAIIEKMLKQRRDSISQYKAANRQDLVDVEEFEVSVLQTYMPQQLSEADVLTAIAEAIAATGAAGPQDMGKVMGVVKPKLAGRADMGKVSGLIKAQLTK